MKSISRGSVPADKFSVPAGFIKTGGALGFGVSHADRLKALRALEAVRAFEGDDAAEPGGGDPGGRRLQELSDDGVFADLPDGATVVEKKRTPAVYTRPAFQTHGWNGAGVVIVVRSSAPPADVFGYYARRAAAAGWRAVKAGALGFTNTWSKTYPDGAEASLSLTFAPGASIYTLDGGTTAIAPR